MLNLKIYNRMKLQFQIMIGVILIGSISNIKGKRYRIYRLNIMDAMTKEERDIYNSMHSHRGKKDIQDLKDKLKKEIESFPANKKREIKKQYLYYFDSQKDEKCTENISKQIVVFENEITRMCDVKKDDDLPLIKEMVVIRCKSVLMAGILEQVIEKGIIIDGAKYIFYTSSTGQMKECEITVLSEDFWKKHKNHLMCGLSEQTINEKGGINTGKYLSALALNMSNSVTMEVGVDIDEVLVVPDFKTIIHDEVNYLDVDSLDISQQEKDIEVEHMDGAGIFIPGTFPCSCQIRGGWVKGAVFPFDFHAFIRENSNKLSKKNMVDAWGNPLKKEDFLKAKLILTDSQLKMRKYYDSLEDYRKKFQESGCRITINNIAHNVDIKNVDSEVRISYQPLQTVPRCKITDESVGRLSEKTVSYINGAKTDPQIALKLIGVDESSLHRSSPLFRAVSECPQMLDDIHVRRTMHNALKAERKKAMGGKVILNGLWSYICPDLYAFCEWLLCGEDNPDGLLKKGYIYNNYYYDRTEVEEVCCIRYPHLSDCEHAVRKVDKSDKCKKWFSGTDTIVSCHDLISKVLQCDWDGDHICVIHDKAFLDVLDKNNLPLYYRMSKAEPSDNNADNIMACLSRSFNNENIGFVSNAITKIFNWEEEPDFSFIRILCAYNNYVIDYFKTQKAMDLKAYKEKYEQLKTVKPPCFFIYAKDKKRKSCEPFNKKSNIDRMSRYIANATKDGITKTGRNSGTAFDPCVLMCRPDRNINRGSAEYTELRRLLSELKLRNKKRYNHLSKALLADLDVKIAADILFYYDCERQIKDITSDRGKAIDYLIDIEYYQSENCDDNKNILWGCYGEILYNNVLANCGKKQMANKRKSYQSCAEKLKKIQELIDQERQKQDSIEKVPIPSGLNELILSQKKLKNDYLLLYVFYVLANRAMMKYGSNYVRIYKRNRNKLTRQTICSWIGVKSINHQMERLHEAGRIKVEEHRSYFKVAILTKMQGESETAFYSVNANPLIDYYRHNRLKKIKECKICHKEFIAEGNQKTCGIRCSNRMKLINKNGLVI